MICRRSAASGSHLAASWGTGDASFQANLVEFTVIRVGWVKNLVIRVPALKTSGIKFQTQVCQNKLFHTEFHSIMLEMSDTCQFDDEIIFWADWFSITTTHGKNGIWNFKCHLSARSTQRLTTRHSWCKSLMVQKWNQMELWTNCFFVDLKVFDDVSGAPYKDVRDSSGHLPMSGVIWLTNTEWWKWWQNRPLLNWRPSPSSESHKRLSTCTLWSREDVKNKFSLDTSRCYAWHDYLTSYQMEKLVILLVRNIQRLLEKDQISPSTLQEHEDDSWHI